jgi:hypothetical protein
MSSSETAAANELTPQEAFPNFLHRAIYYGLTFKNALASARRAKQEADAIQALRSMPGIVYSKEDAADVNAIRWRRREELYEQGHEEVEHLLVEHNLGTPEFQEAVLARLDN